MVAVRSGRVEVLSFLFVPEKTHPSELDHRVGRDPPEHLADPSQGSLGPQVPHRTPRRGIERPDGGRRGSRRRGTRPSGGELRLETVHRALQRVFVQPGDRGLDPPGPGPRSERDPQQRRGSVRAERLGIEVDVLPEHALGHRLGEDGATLEASEHSPQVGFVDSQVLVRDRPIPRSSLKDEAPAVHHPMVHRSGPRTMEGSVEISPHVIGAPRKTRRHSGREEWLLSGWTARAGDARFGSRARGGGPIPIG